MPPRNFFKFDEQTIEAPAQKQKYSGLSRILPGKNNHLQNILARTGPQPDIVSGADFFGEIV
jgi:hypothetical protein